MAGAGGRGSRARREPSCTTIMARVGVNRRRVTAGEMYDSGTTVWTRQWLCCL